MLTLFEYLFIPLYTRDIFAPTKNAMGFGIGFLSIFLEGVIDLKYWVRIPIPFFWAVKV